MQCTGLWVQDPSKAHYLLTKAVLCGLAENTDLTEIPERPHSLSYELVPIMGCVPRLEVSQVFSAPDISGNTTLKLGLHLEYGVLSLGGQTMYAGRCVYM